MKRLPFRYAAPTLIRMLTPRFFLSYARRDHSKYLDQFYDDLADEVLRLSAASTDTFSAGSV
jgi:hypothetical protein